MLMPQWHMSGCTVSSKKHSCKAHPGSAAQTRDVHSVADCGEPLLRLLRFELARLLSCNRARLESVPTVGISSTRGRGQF
jgi:hypothetical protein